MTLPRAFLDRPIAHRALHNKAEGRPENSREAVMAAVESGYGIEIDIQPSKDGVPMVFHDYALTRLTGVQGPIAMRTAKELGAIPLLNGQSGIPTLAEVLEIVAGQVPLLIEIKDQDGRMGPNVGPLERSIADVLGTYSGPVAVMSFNPHSVAKMGELCPQIPRGITTSAYTAEDWPTLPAEVRMHLKAIPDFDRTGACFISHEAADLESGDVANIKAKGAPVLCWTIRSAEAEAKAREIADNITFEGYQA